ncbi:hypothetical protein AKJ09_11271 [Labilithrix luteola]|uniref:Uncharacterized protein n=1 Tax=Labilithrix luteola TaxID=1391654 RepID=A0A0K1QFV7_9BACT|nr:hypothetical protein [Labilithrix luteola]AKV04608.1 hypothetical protein AKJ09_11271 [Labilithrix luteola]
MRFRAHREARRRLVPGRRLRRYAIELGNPERAGLLGWRRHTLGCGGGSSADGTFFWSFYAPLLARIFTSRAH